MNISIITAAFRKDNMDRVWESIKNQTHKEWEWIIVNDNQDEIRQWWSEFKQELDFDETKIFFVDIGMDKNRFGLYSRNVGAQVASYKNLVFLDDDNEWTPNHLESLIKKKQETGKHPFSWIHVKGKKEGSTEDRIKKTAMIRTHIDLGCLLWERRWFDVYGGFRDDSQVTFDFNCIGRILYGEGPHKFTCTENPSLIFWHKRY